MVSRSEFQFHGRIHKAVRIGLVPFFIFRWRYRSLVGADKGICTQCSQYIQEVIDLLGIESKRVAFSVGAFPYPLRPRQIELCASIMIIEDVGDDCLGSLIEYFPAPYHLNARAVCRLERQWSLVDFVNVRFTDKDACVRFVIVPDDYVGKLIHALVVENDLGSHHIIQDPKCGFLIRVGGDNITMAKVDHGFDHGIDLVRLRSVKPSGEIAGRTGIVSRIERRFRR